MNRVQNLTDLQGCYQLWGDCFGDSKQYMEYYFTEKTRDNEIYQIQKDGEVISMLHLNPFSFFLNDRIMKLHYIVGVATKKEERGKGRMRQILTDTLRMQQQRGELFTYLMPAAKEIYLPYDFRYMYAQKRVKGTLRIAQQGVLQAKAYEELTDEKKQEVICYVNVQLKQEFDCAVIRDFDYYARLVLEMQAAGGNVVVFYDGETIIGVMAFMLENGHLEVVETVTEQRNTRSILTQMELFIKEHYSLEQVEAVWLETHYLDRSVIMEHLVSPSEKDQPIIMARLLCAKTAFQMARLQGQKGPVTVRIKVEDPIIEENNQTFLISASETETVVIPAEGLEDVTLSIAELTEWFFGMRNVEALAGLTGLRKPYINDIV